MATRLSVTDQIIPFYGKKIICYRSNYDILKFINLNYIEIITHTSQEAGIY